MWSSTLLLSLCLLTHGEAGRILVLMPYPIWSHYQQFEPLFEALASRGHHVTVYSAYPPSTNLSNFHHVNVDIVEAREFFAGLNHFQLKESGDYGDFTFSSHLQSTVQAFGYGIKMASEIFNNTHIAALITSDHKFDLVIGEIWFAQEALAVFGHKFQAPIIGLISYGTPHTVSTYMGTPNLYSYIPDYKFAFPARMNFLQRLQNTILGVYTQLVGDWWYYPKLDGIMRDFANHSAELPHLTTLLRNVSTTFVYSDVMLEYPRPQTSNLIHVGGIHLRNKKLPKDLQDLMDSATRGVIYVSFGSLIRPSRMSDGMRTLLVTAFSRTGLTVLWRYEGDSIENLPGNVHIRKWIPQQDVLAHPNCRLFISHGGVNSALEAIHYGIPIIGVPFYGDQLSHVRHIVDLGAGVELSYFNITLESIAWATSIVLNNPRYKASALAASRRFKDRPDSPLNTAIWWVEYVLRHHGAPHLRSAYDDLSWAEFLLLDVLAFVSGVVFLVLYILLRMGRMVKRLLSPSVGNKGKSKPKSKRS
ncbi:hypothetical protein M8J75_010991 [Diaphorina citri]|nr:hypothetical protein M8J75_010991 [Diaphorina citri]